MRSIDIPQADSLDQVRRVMVAVCAGARHSHAVRRATGISARHVSYALHAARLLGWLRVIDRQIAATSSGEALLQVLPGSPAERVVFERAVRACPTMNLLAPQLLDPVPPDAVALARHIAALSGIAFETARRRVQTLLSWRHRILVGGVERDASGPAAAPYQSGARPPSDAIDDLDDLDALADSAEPHVNEGDPDVVPHREARGGVMDASGAVGIGSGARGEREGPAGAAASERAHEEGVEPLCLRHLDIIRFGPLRAVHVDLAPLTLVIGGAGAGKSALLEALFVLGDILRCDLPYALARRGVRLPDLVFQAPALGLQGPTAQGFVLGLELNLPLAKREAPRLPLAAAALGVPGVLSLRLEVQVGALADGTPAVLRESLQAIYPGGARRPLISRNSAEGTATLQSEVEPRYRVTVDPGPARLALSFVPRAGGFPAAELLRHLLSHGLRRVLLHPDALRRPCSPLLSDSFAADGSNLALKAQRMLVTDRPRFAQWQAQVCALLPEAQALQVIERPEDRHVYLALGLASGAVPAWRLPDSTLRALALTLLPCVAAPGELYLIEEAEAGLPPELLRGVLTALSGLPRSGAQLLLTAHPGGLLAREGRTPADPGVQVLHLRREGGVTVVTTPSPFPAPSPAHS